jgi:hypothetical protein
MSLAPGAPWEVDDERVVGCRGGLEYVEGRLTRKGA